MHDVPPVLRAGIGTNAGASVILDDGTTVAVGARCWSGRVALSFCDHCDPEIRGRRDPAQITKPVAGLIAWVEDIAGVPVSNVDTGKTASDEIDLGI